MGISIKLYRTPSAESLNEIKNLKEILESPTAEKVDLYKMTEDLSVIFHNNPESYLEERDTFPNMMLFGESNIEVNDIPQLGSFTPSSKVKIINDWIIANEITSWQGFEKIYNNLSVDSKNQLIDIGSPTDKELYEGYVKPLVEFYAITARNNNSMVVCGE